MPGRGRPRTRPVEEPAKPEHRRKAAPPVYDSYAEIRSLITAILRSRGEQGARLDMLQGVLVWARNVRSETEALRELGERQRRPKGGAEPDRLLQNEMNRALLDGVIEGTIIIHLADDGSFSFASSPLPSPWGDPGTDGVATAAADAGTT